MFFLQIHFQLARLKDDFMKHKEDKRTEQVCYVFAKFASW